MKATRRLLMVAFALAIALAGIRCSADVVLGVDPDTDASVSDDGGTAEGG
jgi:hypothetical protein